MIIDEVAFIKEAREIKNRKERIAFIYDKACEILDSQFKGINVCGFLNNKCYSQQKSNVIILLRKEANMAEIFSVWKRQTQAE